MSSITTLKPLHAELAQFRGKRIFFEPLEGNNGDKLIEMGSHTLLQSIDAKLVPNPKQADAIVVNGGAGMTDIWLHGLGTLEKYNSLYSETPLIILPSSFSFTKTDFPALFRDRKAPALIYARERYSLKLLEDFTFPSDVRLGLDHDMAFHLKDTSYFKYLQTRETQKHILIVERDDAERVTNTSHQPQKPNWKRHIPWSIKRPINRHLLWKLNRRSIAKQLGELGLQTEFAQEWHQKVLIDYPEFGTLPVFAADISSPALCSFDRFSQLVADAAVVVSTRLHVAILAAILDKPTYVKSGSYHKIQGIYEYSLPERSNIRLV